MVIRLYIVFKGHLHGTRPAFLALAGRCGRRVCRRFSWFRNTKSGPAQTAPVRLREIEKRGEIKKMETAPTQCLAAFERDFSLIEGLQAASRLSYTLEKAPQGLRIAVRRTGGAAPVRESCLLLQTEQEYGSRLLKFLYENAVPPEQLCDVLQDICGQRLLPEDRKQEM